MIPDLAFWGRLLGVLALELALVVVVLALVSWWRHSPQFRRSLWQAGLAALALILVVECAGLRSILQLLMPVTHPLPERRLVAMVRPLPAPEPGPVIPQFKLPVPDSVATASSEPAARTAVWWPGWLWLWGAALFGGRAILLRGWLAWQRWRSQPGDTETGLTLVRLQGPLGLRRVKLRIWPRLRGPVAFGAIWPTVAVPADFAKRFTPVQREAMLAHELAHLAGRDPCWLAVADAVCALAWWHPGVWWARRQLRAASEAAADEASTLVPEGVTALAESLVVFGRELATSGPTRTFGVAGSGFRSELGRRVAALLETKPMWRPLGAAQRWRIRTAVFGGVVVLSALPWPGTGLPGLIVQETSAQSSTPEHSLNRDETASMERNLVKKDFQRNRVELAGVSTEPLAVPSSLWEVPVRFLPDNPADQHDRTASVDEVASSARRNSLAVTSALGTDAVSSGLWSSTSPELLKARYVQLREEDPTAGPSSPAGTAGAPRVESDGSAPPEPLFTRTYRFRDPDEFLAAIRRATGVTRGTNAMADIRQFLAACGVHYSAPPDGGTPPQTEMAIYFKEGTGMMFVRATLAELDLMNEIVGALGADLDDSREPEIALKVQLAEVPVGSAADVGLDWVFGLSPTNNPVTETTRPNPKANTRVDTLTSEGEWVALKAPQFDALLHSLENRPGTDVLTAPEVTTRSGRQARVVVQDARTIVIGVEAAVDAQTEAVGFTRVSVSATNTQPAISYLTETIHTGPAVDILPHAENGGWRLTTVARMTEFIGYLDPGSNGAPFVRSPGSEPMTAQKPLPWLRVREMQATAVAKPGETIALRGAMITETNITRSRKWLVPSSQTNVVTRRLYAFITPQFAPAPPVGARRASASGVDPLIVRVMANEPGILIGDRRVRDGDLSSALKAAQTERPKLTLLIRADPDAPKDRLQAVSDAALQLGIPNVLLRP